MCLSVLAPLLGGVASAAGGMMTQQAADANAQAQADARNEMLRRTMAENDPLAEESRKFFDKDVKKYNEKKFAKTQTNATADRTEGLEAAVGPVDTSVMPLSGSESPVVREELAKELLKVMDYGTSQAQKLGKIGGYGDTWLERGVKTANTGRKIGINQNFAAGNLAILPYQQDIAELRAYQPISPMGGILQGLGGALGGMGGGGGGGGYSAPSIYG
jgi:hypothetical protein